MVIKKPKYTPPAANDPRMIGLAAEALEKYIEWLNMWFAADPLPDQVPLTEDDFYRYGETRLLGEIRREDEDSHIVYFRAGYGDDGGSAYMTAAFDLDGRYNRAKPTVSKPFMKWMVQEFDTLPSIIYGANRKGVLTFLNTSTGSGQ